MPTADVDIGPWQRIFSASIGALTTSLLVTPLDVTKIRMQVQNTSICDGMLCEICAETGTKQYKYSKESKDAKNIKIKLNVNVNNTNNQTMSAAAIRLSKINQNYYIFSNGLMDHQLPTSRLRIEVFESSCRHTSFKHSFDAFYKIARYEGISNLYSGLGVTLWMAAPATVLYYSTYDLLRNFLLKKTNEWGTNHIHESSTKVISTFMPLISGMTGRLFAVSVISPLELMRTQMMARTINKDLSVFAALKLNLSQGGLLSLWKGLIPSLWRDVPFSGIYWMAYEYYKDCFVKKQLKNISMQNINLNNSNYNNDNIGKWRLFVASFCSGAVSGSIATLCTQPFDVLKTRRQATLLGIPSNKMDIDKKKIVTLAKSIIQNEGVTALYLGLPARMTRVPIACAIMVSTYEVGKILLKSNVTNSDHD